MDAPLPPAPEPAVVNVADAPAPDAPAPDAPAAPVIQAANWDNNGPAPAAQGQGWALHAGTPQDLPPAPPAPAAPTADAPDAAPAGAPAPDAAPVAAPASADIQAPPDGVPHLASPQNLPPGESIAPDGSAPGSNNMSYLKQLWHAVQNQDISGRDALLAVASQRSMMEGAPQESIQAPPNAPAGTGAPADDPAPADAPAPPDAAPAPADAAPAPAPAN
jgi:hypothetical protein